MMHAHTPSSGIPMRGRWRLQGGPEPAAQGPTEWGVPRPITTDNLELSVVISWGAEYAKIGLIGRRTNDE
jgi:hypothetical protein